MFFYLKISCKDKRILKFFLHLFTKIKSLPVSIKSFPKHEKRKFITVLKSPHVNKTAQEQFECRLYSRHFLARSLKPATFLLLLKKLRNLSLSGLNLKVEGLLEKKKMHEHVLQIANPDNIILKKVYNSNLSKKKFKKVYRKKSAEQTPSNSSINLPFCKKYVQLFDLYGEMCLKKAFHL